MKITIGGASGTGTSTIARKLAEKYNYKFYSGGSIQRMNAAKRNMTIEDYDVFLKSHLEIDQEVEKTQIEIGKNEDDFVMESRMAWFCVPDSIKIKLDCEQNKRIQRIVDSINKGERISQDPMTFEEAVQKTLEREESYTKRWDELYNVGWNDNKNFDFIVDTSEIGIDEVLKNCVEFVESKK
jgi:cytidylate kinase